MSYFPIIMLLTADTAQPQEGLGGVIGHCYTSAEAEMYVRVIDVLNASIEGGAFYPSQCHAPGHA